MLDSKPIDMKKLEESFLERLLPSPIKNYIVYPVQYFINKYSERISRSFAFAKIGWLNYDFESLYIFDLMSFKLKRIEDCLKNGYGVQEDEDMQALKEAIEICDRLCAGDYDSKYLELHNKKWRELPSWTTEPTDNSKYRRLVLGTRLNVKSEEDRKLERKEFLQCFDDGELDRRKDLDRLNHLFKEHLPKWWD